MDQVLLLMRDLCEERQLLERFRDDMHVVFSEYGLNKDDVIDFFQRDCRHIISQFPTDHLALTAAVTPALSVE